MHSTISKNGHTDKVFVWKGRSEKLLNEHRKKTLICYFEGTYNEKVLD